MSSEIKIHISKDNTDHNRIVKFLDDALPFNYSMEAFLWEYGDTNSVFGYLKDDQNEVLGAQGMIPIKLNLNGAVVLTAKSETSYLSPKTKGQGLFKKLYSEVVTTTFNGGIPIIWGFTTLGTLWQKLGFEVKNTCLYTYSLSIIPDRRYYLSQNQGGKKFRKYLRYVKAALNAGKTTIKAKKTLKTGSKNGFVIKNEPLTPNDIEVFYGKLRDKYPGLIHLELDDAYLAYRLTNNPYLNYTTKFVYDSKDELQGFYFFSVKDKVGHLAEFSALNESARQVLLGEAVKEAKHLKVARLNIFGNKLNPEVNLTFQLFDRWGSTNFDSEMYIVVLKREPSEMDFSKWYINGLWTEGINQ